MGLKYGHVRIAKTLASDLGAKLPPNDALAGSQGIALDQLAQALTLAGDVLEREKAPG